MVDNLLCPVRSVKAKYWSVGNCRLTYSDSEVNLNAREQLAKLTNNFIAAYNTNTPEGAIAFRSSDCRHSVLPTTAHFSTAFTNEEYKAYVT